MATGPNGTTPTFLVCDFVKLGLVFFFNTLNHFKDELLFPNEELVELVSAQMI